MSIRAVILAALLLASGAAVAQIQIHKRPGSGTVPIVTGNCLLISGTVANCLLISGTTTNALLVK